MAWRGDCAGSRTCFLSAADVYTADQVTLFGEVMGRLADNADRLSLAELSGRLAPVARAPLNVLHSLARHGDIAVWGPVLEQAAALPDEDLVEIADKDPADPNKLMKIAARPQLGAAVTDVLFKRGDRAIQRTIIAGRARIGIRLRQADHEPQWDKDLAAAIAARDDVPAELRPWLSKILD